MDKKFKHYPMTMIIEAIRLHVEEKWTYKQITEHLGIQDKDRVKKWMRKYKQLGDFDLLDQRGRRKYMIKIDMCEN